MGFIHIVILAFKIVLRRGASISSLALFAILCSILSSVYSMANYISQEAFGIASRISGSGFLSIACSGIECQRVRGLLGSTEDLVFYVEAGLEILDIEVMGRGVSAPVIYTNISAYRDALISSLRGDLPRGVFEALVGERLAGLLGVGLGDELLIKGGVPAVVRVSGIYSSRSSMDGMAIVIWDSDPCGSGRHSYCLIRIYLRDQGHINKILEALRGSRAIISSEALNAREFIAGINREAGRLVSLWSLVVLAIVMASSYMLSIKLSIEFRDTAMRLYELGVGRAGLALFLTMLIIITSLIGSVIGVSIGLVAIGIISTTSSWVTGSVRPSPYLELWDYISIVSMTLISSILGGIPLSIYQAMRIERGGGGAKHS